MRDTQRAVQPARLGEAGGCRLQAVVQIVGFGPGKRRSDLDTKLAGQAHGGERRELAEPVGDLRGTLVVLRQSPGPRGITYRYPRRAHVVKVGRS